MIAVRGASVEHSVLVEGVVFSVGLRKLPGDRRRGLGGATLVAALVGEAFDEIAPGTFEPGSIAFDPTAAARDDRDLARDDGRVRRALGSFADLPRVAAESRAAVLARRGVRPSPLLGGALPRRGEGAGRRGRARGAPRPRPRDPRGVRGDGRRAPGRLRLLPSALETCDVRPADGVGRARASGRAPGDARPRPGRVPRHRAGAGAGVEREPRRADSPGRARRRRRARPVREREFGGARRAEAGRRRRAPTNTERRRRRRAAARRRRRRRRRRRGVSRPGVRRVRGGDTRGGHSRASRRPRRRGRPRARAGRALGDGEGGGGCRGARDGPSPAAYSGKQRCSDADDSGGLRGPRARGEPRGARASRA